MLLALLRQGTCPSLLRAASLSPSCAIRNLSSSSSSPSSTSTSTPPFRTEEFGDKSEPVVVVLQEWWGVNEELRLHAKRIAEQGFHIIVPDLYHGKSTLEKEEAEHLLEKMDFPKAVDQLDQLIAFLRQGVPTRKVGMLGFCMGSVLAIATAEKAKNRLDAVVGFYGIPPVQLGDPFKLDTPLLYQMGELDNQIGFSDAKTTDQFQASLLASGKPFELYRYPTVGHAFMNQTPTMEKTKKELGFPPYDPAVAKTAWERTFKFLQKHLKE